MIRVKKNNTIKYCTHCDKPAAFLLYYTNPRIVQKSSNGALCDSCIGKLAVAIAKCIGHKPEDEQKYSKSDWKYEVANGDTNLGYHEWLDHMIESES